MEGDGYGDYLNEAVGGWSNGKGREGVVEAK
jgi:hypothetical protein